MRQRGGRERSRHVGICSAGYARRTSRLASAAAVAALGMLFAGLGPAPATGEPALEPKPVNTVAPALTGTPAVGQTLSCATGSWTNDPSGYSFVWLRDGTPIAGQTGSAYTVQSADRGHSISCQVTASNSGGEYTIGGLPSGSYRVSFSAYGEGVNYLSQYYNGRALEGEANPVAVTAPNATAGIDAALSAGGQIAGRVTAASGGAALANIEVCVMAPALLPRCTTTNAGGEYTLTSLPSGSYSVEFYSFEAEVFSASEGGNYLSQSDPGVSVTAGNTTSNVDAALPTGGQIAGKATGAEGGGHVEVCAYEGAEEFSSNCASTNAAGEYTISRLASGDYKVRFSRGDEGPNYAPQYYNDKSSLVEGEAVAVTAGSTTAGVDAALSAGGQIAGKVTAASGGAALANIKVCAEEAGGFEFFGDCATTNAGGEYTIMGLASGKYMVSFSGSTCGIDSCAPQNYLDQFYKEQSSFAAAEEVMVAAPQTTEKIDAALLTGGQIAGRVTAASGGAVLANVEVCARTTHLFGGCATTDASGEYTISALPTGTYIVEFSYEEEGGNYLPLSDGGVPVTAGGTASVDAALSPGGQIAGRVTAASGGAGLANIVVCARAPRQLIGGCATTNGGGGSATAASDALKVTATGVALTRTAFDARTGDLDFYFQFVEPGTLRWSLFFKNADIGFAASLGLLSDEAETGSAAAGPATGAEVALAETARRRGRRSKRCDKGDVRRRGRCVGAPVPFADGSKHVDAGSVEVKVHADARALKALDAGRTLHVSGRFTFQSALGGPLVADGVSTLVHGHRRAGERHGKKKRR
jgi:Carboxypeptidase regulatory-like domain